MVFNNPTLPWERTPSSVLTDDDATNTVPWLAVLLFTQDELRLSSSHLSTMLPSTSVGTTAKQSDMLTVNMLARRYAESSTHRPPSFMTSKATVQMPRQT
jgi:hypothetical protein